jgi:hypothetical protein
MWSSLKSLVNCFQKMKIPGFPSLLCPDCGGTVSAVEEELDVGDVFLMLFGDWPFWLMFLACSALGIWSPLAAVIALAFVLAIWAAWKRAKSTYKCEVCEKRFSFDAAKAGGRGCATNRRE